MSQGMLCTVKAGPQSVKLRSTGLMPSAWPGMPRRSMASLRALVPSLMMSWGLYSILVCLSWGR